MIANGTAMPGRPDPQAGAEDHVTEEQANAAPAPEDATARPSVAESFAQLISDGRDYVAAEAERQTLRAKIVASGVQKAAILAIIALMLIFATVVTMMVGITFALAQHMRPIWAAMVVTGGGLAVAIVLLLLAKMFVTRSIKAVKP